MLVLKRQKVHNASIAVWPADIRLRSIAFTAAMGRSRTAALGGKQTLARRPKSGNLIIRAATGTLEHQIFDLAGLNARRDDTVAACANVIDVSMPPNKGFVRRRGNHWTNS